MSTLNNLLLYLYREFPTPLSLGASRAVKMIFLSDWNYSVKYTEPMTGIRWRNSDRGPFSYSISETLSKDEDNFFIEPNNAESLRSLSFVIVPKNNSLTQIDLDEKYKKIIDNVIKETHSMVLWQLNSLIEAQFPMRLTEQGDDIDLLHWANIYKDIMESPKRVEDFIRNYKRREVIHEESSASVTTFQRTSSMQSNYSNNNKTLYIKRLK